MRAVEVADQLLGAAGRPHRFARLCDDAGHALFGGQIDFDEGVDGGQAGRRRGGREPPGIHIAVEVVAWPYRGGQAGRVDAPLTDRRLCGGGGQRPWRHAERQRQGKQNT